MAGEIKVEGLRELREALLKKIPAHFQGKVLQKALSAGAKPIIARARSLAPVDTGRLRRAIYSTRDKSGSTTGYEQRVISVRRGKKMQKTDRDAYYWKFIEFGHKTRGETTVDQRPFLRPAFDSEKRNAAEAIRDSLAKEIPKAARKAAWRTRSKR